MTPSAENRWTLLIGGALLLLLVGALIVWFFENFEREERMVRTGLSAEARGNPYLAAERYLDRLGYAAETVRGREHLKSPPEYAGALVVSDPGPALPPGEEQRLLDWVAAGGHLVLAAQSEWNEDTPSSGTGLLDELGVRLHRRLRETDNENTARPDDEQEIVTVHATEAGRRHLAAFDTTYYLEDVSGTARRSVDGKYGAHLLGWQRGSGRITVLSDDGFMRNGRIGELDHAWLVSDLLKAHDRVWLLIDASIPSLTDWLWRHAPQAMVSAGLLIVLWLWRTSLTHGPRRRPRHRVRRSIIEHLGAAAAFAWRQDRARHLQDGARAGIEAAWTRRYPKLARMDRRARCEWIAGHADLPVAQVSAALYEPPADEQALIHTAAVQQRLLMLCRRGSHIPEEQT